MKKLISLFTTVCIVFGVLGTFTVFADETAADLEISTLTELEAFRDDVNNGNTYEGKTVELTADIDMSEKYGEGKESWTPIGDRDYYNRKEFSGTFDGNGHKISKLYFYNDNENSGIEGVGLFAFNSGTIKNLGVDGSITQLYYSAAGGITADSVGTIENCYFSGMIKSPAHTGGITGCNAGMIKDCYNTADITARHGGGGIAGLNDGGTITRCYNIGKVEKEKGYEDFSECFGSIAGFGTDETVVDCYYLEGTYDIGAYAGESADPTTALTTEQFADKTNFANWDFETVWDMDETLKRPVLWSNREEPPVHIHNYSIKYENGKAVVTVPEDGTYTVIFAAYEDGRLVSVSPQNVSLVKGENPPVSPQNFTAGGKVKVMLWNSLKDMKPLCDAD